MRDYVNPKVEWALAISSMAAAAWLVRYYFAAPEHHDLRMVFGVPAIYLYLQVGMLFVKRVVVAWRTPVPQAQAAEYLEAREQTRKYYLRVCDWCRAWATAAIVFWAVLLGFPPDGKNRALTVWFVAGMAASVIAGVWGEIRRKQLVTVALRARPVKLPDFMGESEMAKWPLCYQPSAPMLVLKGARGYSLNLANTLSHLGAAYLAGMAGLIVLLVMRR